MGNRYTNEILEDWWHATARAPRAYPGARLDGDYESGLDILGALVLKKRLPVPVAAPRIVPTAPAGAPSARTAVPPTPAPRPAASPSVQPMPPPNRVAIPMPVPVVPVPVPRVPIPTDVPIPPPNFQQDPYANTATYTPTAPNPDPNNPGYLTNGALDPNYQSPFSPYSGDSGGGGSSGGGSSGSDEPMDLPAYREVDPFADEDQGMVIDDGSGRESDEPMEINQARLDDPFADEDEADTDDDAAENADDDTVLGLAPAAWASILEAMSDHLQFDTRKQAITDEAPDPLRQRASKHMGAAYLDRKYPPGGSSHGQEGGWTTKPIQTLLVPSAGDGAASQYDPEDVQLAGEILGEVLGVKFEWWDLLVPGVGVGIRAMQEGQDKGGGPLIAPAPDTVPQGKASPEVARRLLQAQQHLADVKRQHVAHAALSDGSTYQPAAGDFAQRMAAARAGYGLDQGDDVMGSLLFAFEIVNPDEIIQNGVRPDNGQRDSWRWVAPGVVRVVGAHINKSNWGGGNQVVFRSPDFMNVIVDGEHTTLRTDTLTVRGGQVYPSTPRPGEYQPPVHRVAKKGAIMGHEAQVFLGALADLASQGVHPTEAAPAVLETMKADQLVEQNAQLIYGDYARGLDVMGAIVMSRPTAPAASAGAVVAKPATRATAAAVSKSAAPTKRAGFVQKTTPAGKKVISLALLKPKKATAAIKNARDAGNRAVSLGNKLKAIATKMAKSPPKAPTRVHGAPSAHPVHVLARHAVSVQQLKKLADGAIKAGKDVLKKADQHETLIKANAQRQQAGVKALAKSLAGKNHVIGGDLDAANAWATVCGELAADVLEEVLYGTVPVDPNNPPDPQYPGWLMDGTPDPNYVSNAAPDPSNPGYLLDGSADPAYGGGAGATTTAGPPDYGFGSPPTAPPALVPGQDFMPDPGPQAESNVFYSSDPTKWGGVAAPPDIAASGLVTVPVPDGVVYYDGTSHGAGNVDTFGSWERTHGSNKLGFLRGDGGWDNRDNNGDNNNIDINVGPFGNQTATIAFRSFQHHTGPLMTRKRGDWSDNLRFDTATGAFFWFRDKAPAWATQPDDLTRLNQAILDYKANVAAAAADAAAQAAQDKLDADQAAQLAKQQAAEDAQMARQQQLEESDAQHQAALQQTADQQAASAAGAQQQVADESYQRQMLAEVEAQRQQGLAQADIDQRYQAMQPQYDDGGGQYDDGGGQYQDPRALLEDDSVPDDGGGDLEADTGANNEGLSDEEAQAVLEDDAPPDDDMMGLRGSRGLRQRIRQRQAR